MINAVSGVARYGFLQNKNRGVENRYLNFAAPKDTFVRSKNISFGASYERSSAINYIEKIDKENIQPVGRGFQGAFYKLDAQTGIKVPRPMYPNSPNADIFGLNNIKEHFILKKLQAINPEIAVKPIDLIQKDNKNYLVMDVVKGEHPFNTKLNGSHFADIMQKAFLLDTNGIAHSDLQSGNIFLSANKAKFIDFGSYNLLTNEGKYMSSEIIAGADFLNSSLDKKIDSPLKNRFLAVFYSNEIPLDLKNYSDNRHLKIKSNASNFEFRTVYDYLKQGKSQNPIETLTEYLKAKSENYHKPMAEFLQSLEISPSDTKQLNERKAALENEKLFAEMFLNPSENILKAELGKMQLKWLINDYQGANAKAFDYFNKYMTELNTCTLSSNGREKAYFHEMKEMITQYKEMLNQQIYKGAKLEEKDNLIKTIFDKTKLAVQEPPSSTFINPNNVKTQNKAALIAAGLLIIVASVGTYLFKKFKPPASNNRLESAGRLA